MNYLGKVAIATAGLGTTAGVSVAGYLHLASYENFSDKLGESLLNLTGEENGTVWTKRFEDLKKPYLKLDAQLTAIKGQKWQDLQKWCRDNKGSKFKDKDDEQYQRFETYCTWKIGDKLTRQIADNVSKTDNKWKQAHTRLKTKKREDLAADLQKVFDVEETGNNNKDKEAMHGWCTTAYKNTWQGSKDNRLPIVQEYCEDK